MDVLHEMDNSICFHSFHFNCLYCGVVFLFVYDSPRGCLCVIFFFCAHTLRYTHTYTYTPNTRTHTQTQTHTNTDTHRHIHTNTSTPPHIATSPVKNGFSQGMRSYLHKFSGKHFPCSVPRFKKYALCVYVCMCVCVLTW